MKATKASKTKVKTSRQLALLCAKLVLEKKAFNLVLMDVRPWQSLMDYVLICSATSPIQAQTIARFIKDTLKQDNIHCLGTEGYGEGKWILLDFSGIVIHIFYEYLRDVYDLETLWHDAKRIRTPTR